LVSVMC